MHRLALVAKRIVALLGLIVFTLAFAEIFVRLVAPQALMPRYVTGAPWGVRRNIPNADYWHITPDVKVEYRINRWGMRDDRDFTLADLFDGYIFLAPFGALAAATPDPTFLDEGNIDRAIEQYPDPDWSIRPADLAAARAHLDDMAKQINDRYAALARRF